MKSLLPEVHFKHALHLEDKAMYKEAEEEFVKVCTLNVSHLLYVFTDCN
jgi:hypothetical protein